jgi:DNA-binding beta-propeller fold protein YncE
LDGEKGLLFVGCGEGKAVAIDVTTGKVVSSLKAGSGVDGIAFAAGLAHLYVPGGGSADLSILGVSGSGQLSLLDKVKTGPGAHTAAFDPEWQRVYIGLPEHGQVLIVEDSHEPSSP